jgi:PIN domain nuclease of toxin-antitoxin system
VRLLALDPAVAVAATRLPEPFHADPADRFLVAQARELGIPLLSADSKIRS